MTTNYDFKGINSHEFELLCRDLLQAELGLRLETFKQGADQGIDIRGHYPDNQTLIVQCKHYANSGFSKLFNSIKNEEIPKIKNLSPRPSKYYVMTSVKLTPYNKKKICDLAPDIFENDSSILGLEDINNLLGLHPEVLKKNSCLWLKSIEMLELVQSMGTFNRSEAWLEKIKKTRNLFVSNQSFNEALDILKEHKTVIISGIPGVGKTMLADMLCFTLASENYEVVKLTENISEAWQLINNEGKRIFYYDDFLGQSKMNDYKACLSKNEDKSILDFDAAIKARKNTLFVLTTREYLLEQLYDESEAFDLRKEDLKKYTLDLSAYTKKIKAEILYNHLYHLEIKKDILEAVLTDKFYLSIIEHKNYNPRLIETLVNIAKNNYFTPLEYKKKIIELLDNPAVIWKFAFEKQDETSQFFLCLLLTFGQGVPPEKLKRSFTGKYRLKDFNNSYRKLLGTFVISYMLPWGDEKIDFHNPSVKDFLRSYVNEASLYFEDLIHCSLDMNQLFKIWKIFDFTNGDNRHILRDEALINIVLLKMNCYNIDGMSALFGLEILLDLLGKNNNTRIFDLIETFLSVCEHAIGSYSQFRAVSLYEKYYTRFRDASLAKPILFRIKQILFNNCDDLFSLSHISGLCQFDSEFLTCEEKQELKNKFESEDFIYDEVFNIEHLEHLEEYSQSFEEAQKTFDWLDSERFGSDYETQYSKLCPSYDENDTTESDLENLKESSNNHSISVSEDEYIDNLFTLSNFDK